MAVTIQGDWKVKVTVKNAAFDQRFIVSGSIVSDGVYPGTVGTRVEADGASWTIQIQNRSSASSPWVDSDMRTGPETPSGISVIRVVESNDQGADQDFDDLVLELRKKQNPIIAIAQRPFAIDPRSLIMNPDGIFYGGGGGVQVMAVRVRNTWTRTMPADQVLDISDLGRLQLAAVGIQVVDAWTARELGSFGQTMFGPTRAPVIGPLAVGDERTVYFKLDGSAAHASAPEVEFIARRPVPEPDLDDPARLAGRKIFVTEVRYDSATREVTARAPEGLLRLQLKQISLDPHLYNAMRDCIRRAVKAGGARGARARGLRTRTERMLRDLQAGRCDTCSLRELIELFCECVGDDGGAGGGGGGSGGINTCPFPWLPIRFSYTVEAPFSGQHGPLPFQDPWWKVLAWIICAALLIAAAIVDIFEEAHENEEIVIGEVARFSRDNVDCSIASLYGVRGVDLGVLDALSGEPNTNARIALDGIVPIVRAVAPAFVGMKVYKSGARTGLTHGLVTSTTATTNQCRGEFEDSTNTCHPDPATPNLVMTNQIRIGTSADFPTEPTTDHGDSGSLWLSDEPATRDQVVGLTHSGRTGSSDANPITDVLAALDIRLTP
jgi:hypothetical protein